MVRVILSLIVLVVLIAASRADVVAYEGKDFPETGGWDRLGTFDCDRWIESGLFHQFCDLGVWPGPRFGEDDFYQRPVSAFTGQPTFFVTWRLETDAPSAILDFFGTPTVVSIASTTGAYYHFRFTDERVLVVRGNFLPLVYVDIQPGVPHTYYVELRGLDQYAWYIDDQLIDSGVPDGPYPTIDSLVVWGARRDTFDNHAQWEYIRYGTIPQPASGDFDSNGFVDQAEVYFFLDCLLGPDAAGPGCRWADMNNDGAADGQDISLFVGALLAG